MDRSEIAERIKRRVAREVFTRSAPIVGQTVIALDYPPSAENARHHADGHPRLDARLASEADAYRRSLQTIAGFAADLTRIELHATAPGDPSWINGFLPALDSAALYAFLRAWSPRRYVEIGSGNSTKFAARARTDGRLPTEIISIDPHPRAEVNPLCDRIVRHPSETLDHTFWAEVQSGDVVFLDGSHRVFMNSDATVFFLDVLPELPSGVLVGIHDIYLPFDYPPGARDAHYSEQYLLAAYLLGGADVSITLPSQYAWTRMRPDVDQLWATMPTLAAAEHHGVAFWLTTT